MVSGATMKLTSDARDRASSPWDEAIALTCDIVIPESIWEQAARTRLSTVVYRYPQYPIALKKTTPPIRFRRRLHGVKGEELEVPTRCRLTVELSGARAAV